MGGLFSDSFTLQNCAWRRISISCRLALTFTLYCDPHLDCALNDDDGRAMDAEMPQWKWSTPYGKYIYTRKKKKKKTKEDAPDLGLWPNQRWVPICSPQDATTGVAAWRRKKKNKERKKERKRKKKEKDSFRRLRVYTCHAVSGLLVMWTLNKDDSTFVIIYTIRWDFDNFLDVCVCVWVCVRSCMRACVRACVCVCVCFI